MSNSEKNISSLIAEYQSSPLLPLEFSKLIKDLRKEDVSLNDFNSSYNRDPLLCSYLIDAAWAKARNKDNPPFAADHAMSSLGIVGAKQLVNTYNAPNKSKRHTNQISDEIRFMLSSSLLAAEIARNLVASKPKANALYWATLTYQFPDTLLWSLKPRSMWRIQYRQLKLPKKLPLFEQAKLGFELTQWRQAVAKEWHMGELNRLTYEKQPPFSRKELSSYIRHGYSALTPSLKEWQMTDSWLILTANWLARAIMAAWLKNSFRHYSSIAQRAYNVSDKKLQSSVRQAIASSSRQLKGSDLFIPAVSYLQLSGSTQYPEWLNAAAKIPLKRSLKYSQPSAELKQQANLVAVQKFTQELTAKPAKYRNTNLLLRKILDLATDKLNYSRASLLVVDWNNKKVSTAMFATSKDQNKIKLGFDFDQNTPLKKFLVEQAFFVFDKSKHQKIWPRLPTDILQQQVDKFLFCSFKPNKKVDYLFYIDALGQSNISTEKLKVTKQLLLTANKVISYNLSKT